MKSILIPETEDIEYCYDLIEIITVFIEKLKTVLKKFA